MKVLDLQVLVGGTLLDDLLTIFETLLLINILLLVVDALSLLQVEGVLLILQKSILGEGEGSSVLAGARETSVHHVATAADVLFILRRFYLLRF